jgi:hypothetical protein
MKYIRLAAVASILLSLTSCSLIAMPFRVAADVTDVIPLVGSPVAGVLDGTGNVIDHRPQNN